ncbi:hypothetical protein QWZ14_11580 [Paeniroseomonas aquatica]|uniref:MmcQ/YjbR family DNA-binding protein n=1 Tax=Paeniroseomonas aquatica TaxID=373043 RepID=A0ABT8A5V0_9PROT|nr:hypothetical protein [Paeniroseomonas aquatica]MDN3565001.1 hypothetical protein [Paeniroseomonas aquatica]
MTWDDALAIGLQLPGMEASTSYGTPALKVRGRLVTRLLTEDDSLVLLSVPPDERAVLIEIDSQVFHITPHYEGYPAVLARLATLESERLLPFLKRRWREVAPKRVVASYEEARVKSR